MKRTKVNVVINEPAFILIAVILAVLIAVALFMKP
jgi:hypothetical protein